MAAENADDNISDGGVTAEHIHCPSRDEVQRIINGIEDLGAGNTHQQMNMADISGGDKYFADRLLVGSLKVLLKSNVRIVIGPSPTQSSAERMLDAYC